MVFKDNGQLETVYDKIHLVPFGEYLPFQSTLETIGLQQLAHWRGGFSVGSSPRPLLTIPGLPPVSALICYEAIFPASVVEGSERPGLLLNVTNDGWFGATAGPWQHFHQARVRAVEEGLPLVRAANNGVSAMVDAHGRVLAMLGLNERGTIDNSLPAALTVDGLRPVAGLDFRRSCIVLCGNGSCPYPQASHLGHISHVASLGTCRHKREMRVYA